MSELEQKAYKLQLEGEGIAVNKVITEEIALKIMCLIMGAQIGFPPPRNAEQNAITPTQTSQLRTFAPTLDSTSVSTSIHPTSPREYLNQVEAKTNPEKILALAAYALETSESVTFVSEDIKNMFPRASERIPANYTRDFRWVESNGWIAQNPQEDGRYYITNTGRKALSEKFPKELSKSQPGYLKRKKKAKSIKQVISGE